MFNGKVDDEDDLKHAYGQDIKAGSDDFISVDEVHAHNRRRVNGCLKEIQDIITGKAKELLENPQELHSLVNEKRRKDIRDIIFLLEKTKVFENPRDVTKKIL